MMPFWRIAIHNCIDGSQPRVGLLRALDQSAAERTAAQLTHPDRRFDLSSVIPDAGKIPDLGQVIWDDDAI
jgi:hypothetical protein